MTKMQTKQSERLKAMMDMMGTDKRSISNFIQESRNEIKTINHYIRQVQLAERMLTKYFDYLHSDEDRKEIVKIAEKFPEIRTAKQIETIFYILKGFSAKQISNSMNCTEKTVKFHKTNIYRTLKIKTQAELMAYYYGAKYNDSMLPEGLNEQC